MPEMRGRVRMGRVSERAGEESGAGGEERRDEVTVAGHTGLG